MKKTLFYVELHGIKDTYILLVEKVLIDWIDGRISAPAFLIKAWEKDIKEYSLTSTPQKMIAQLEPGSGSSPHNDRALSIPEEACVLFVTEVRDYAEWYSKNKNKYIIKDGYYGAIY